MDPQPIPRDRNRPKACANPWDGNWLTDGARLALGLGVILALTWMASAQTSGTGVPSLGFFPERPGVAPASPTLRHSLDQAADAVAGIRTPREASDWAARRPEVESRLRRSLGLESWPERTPLRAREVARHAFEGYTLANVVFESRPGFPVTANLYEPSPRGQERRPVVVTPIGHFLSAGKAAAQVQARCQGLVRLGFVVMAYDAIGQGERQVPGNIHHDAGYALLPLGETVAGWMVWDTLRALDYVETLPGIDPSRLGVTGNSGGGLNTWLSAALDPRIAAGAIAGFCCEFSHWARYGGTHCTCTHLPGLFELQWFEVAGLTAPRPLLILQGERDLIFPITGARAAGRATEGLYAMAGVAGRARFDEIAGEGHGYFQSFRERMYGWMAWHLQGRGQGEPIPEAGVAPLDESDRRLRCDPDRQWMPRAPTVVDLACARAKEFEALRRNLGVNARLQAVREAILRWTSLPAEGTGDPAVRIQGTRDEAGVRFERWSLVSEDGQGLPAWTWRPSPPATVNGLVLVVDDRGKTNVAASGWVESLVRAGRAVVAVDVRGRGETLEAFGPRHNINFRLAANQLLLDQPLAGRRAYDVRRTLDALQRQPEFRALAEVSVVGVGDDGLTALLAAAADSRFRKVVVVRGVHGFASLMVARTGLASEPVALSEQWNDPQLDGLIAGDGVKADFGHVLPGVLKGWDLVDLARSVTPRQVWFCEARDVAVVGPGVREAWTSLTNETPSGSVQYQPDRMIRSDDWGEILGTASW